MSTFRRRRGAAGPLVLWTSPNCGLCDRAREALAEAGLDYSERDTPDDHTFRLRTPVLEAGGRVVAEGEIDAEVLKRKIRPG